MFLVWHDSVKEQWVQTLTNENQDRKIKNYIGNRSCKEVTELQNELYTSGEQPAEAENAILKENWKQSLLMGAELPQQILQNL